MRATIRLPWLRACLALLVLNTTAAGKTLDLTGAINHALDRNRSLVVSGLNRDAAAVGVTSASAPFEVSVRPVLALNTTTESDSTSTAGVNVSKRFTTGTVITSRVTSEDLGVASGERATIELRQPLFRRAGRLVNEEPMVQAANALLSSRRRFEQQRIDLIVEVVRTYEDILRLERQTEADEKALQRAERLYQSTRAKEALGRASRIDLLRVELQRGQALSRLETDLEALGAANLAFAELLGVELDEQFDLQPTRLLEVDFESLEEAARSAFENRLDYAEAVQELRDSGRAIRIARKQLLPDLSIVARYERRSDSLGSDFGLDDNFWFLGLRTDTDFNPAQERAAVRRAEIDRASARQSIAVLELRIARDLQQRALAYRRAHAELRILERNVAHARSRLELAQRLFEIGRGDNFSVTDAEEAFLRAESDYLTGRARASISGYELLRAMGTLTEVPADLKPAAL